MSFSNHFSPKRHLTPVITTARRIGSGDLRRHTFATGVIFRAHTRGAFMLIFSNIFASIKDLQ